MAFVPPARHLLRAKDLADARYFEPLGVDDMARAAGLSRAHFSREFRRAFGESPHAYLLTRRLERAAALLRTTDRSVADICFSVGLQSVGSFTTSFTRTYGMSPTAYRAAFPPRPQHALVPACVVRAYARPQHRTFREDSARGARLSLARDPFRLDPGGPKMIKIANAQLWVHDQDEALAFYTAEARHGAARRRDAARDGRLPLAHRRAGRAARRRDRADGHPRPAGDGPGDGRAGARA